MSDYCLPRVINSARYLRLQNDPIGGERNGGLNGQDAGMCGDLCKNYTAELSLYMISCFYCGLIVCSQQPVRTKQSTSRSIKEKNKLKRKN